MCSSTSPSQAIEPVGEVWKPRTRVDKDLARTRSSSFVATSVLDVLVSLLVFCSLQDIALPTSGLVKGFVCDTSFSDCYFREDSEEFCPLLRALCALPSSYLTRLYYCLWIVDRLL